MSVLGEWGDVQGRRGPIIPCQFRFLRDFTSLPESPSKQQQSDYPDSRDLQTPRLPIMVTDWDGTMKDYCSQYATNLQPVYTALSMARFAERFTRLTAVLTAGPLRGPGILDLTALPIDGPVMFSGSWGREWWLGGKRGKWWESF